MRTPRHCISIIVSIALGATTLLAQIPNGGFEDWTDDGSGVLNPDGWVTSNGGPDLSVEQYSPAFAGDHSMLVRTWDPGFTTLSGTSMARFAYNLRPSILHACMKATVMSGDKVFLIAALSQGDSIIASPLNCTFWMDTSVTQFTCFDFPITYNADLIPDSAMIIVMAGASGTLQLGTEIIVDELEFQFTTGVDGSIEASKDDAPVFPNPASTATAIPFHLNSGSNVTLELFDVRGQQVRSSALGMMPAGDQRLELDVQELPVGIYHFVITTREGRTSGRVSVAR